MFDWIGDAIDWIGDGISSLWDNTIGSATEAIGDWIWECMFEWLFNLIFGAVSELFEFINESAADMLMKLYGRFGMDDGTNFDQFTAEDYPTMSDLYELIEKEFMAFDSEKKHLYTEEMLQNICLGLNSISIFTVTQQTSISVP